MVIYCHQLHEKSMASAADSPNTESLFELLRACQRGQRVAIVGGHTDETDNQLQNELYVRQNEDEEVDSFFNADYEKDGKLLVLTGSAGDGKTALLTRGYDAHGEDLPQARVNLDATEARRRDGDYVDRLSNFFNTIINEIKEESGHRSAIAINYGLAVDYFERRDTPEEHRIIWDAMRQQSTPEKLSSTTGKNIKVINLSYRRTYNTDPEKLGKGLVRDLLDRFDPTNEESPFTDAYEREKEHCPAGSDCVLLYNIRQLTQTEVKNQLARLMAGWSISTGAYLNPRTIIDNIASMILPPNLRELPYHDVCAVGHAIEENGLQPSAENLVWNAAFKTIETDMNAAASHLDPASYTDFKTDQRALRWASDDNELTEKMCSVPNIEYDDDVTVGRIRTYLRKEYLENVGGRTIIDEPMSEEFNATYTFLKQYGSQNHPPKQIRAKTSDLFDTTRKALSNWTGQLRDDDLVEFVDGTRSTDYRYLSDGDDPSFGLESSIRKTQSLAVPGKIKLMAERENADDIPVPISFETYKLMTQISKGYTPNTTDLDQSHAIRMLNSRLDDFTNKQERIIIERRAGGQRLKIETNEFDQVTVTKEGFK